MQDRNMQKIIEGLIGVGDGAKQDGDDRGIIMVSCASALTIALCQINDTLEEIRDAIKEKGA